MDLDPFLSQLRRDLTAAARTGGEDIQTAASHLVAALDPAARLVLLDVLVSAADEVTSLTGTTVEVRLRGRDVDLVAHAPAEPVEAFPPPPAPPTAPPVDGDDATARVSLRLPETLKTTAEARAVAEGISLNTWLVRAVVSAVGGSSPRRSHGPGTRLTGWARS
jgi:hypothetical protein